MEEVSVVPQSMLLAMRDAGLGRVELAVMLALISQPPSTDGELGVANGGVMSSVEVSEYTGIPAVLVRRAVMGLKRKGLISTSRYASDGGARKAVYKLVDESLARDLASCFEAYENMEV